MPSCAFTVCAKDTRCAQPGGYRVVYEIDDEPGETEDYRCFCRAHAERYAAILLASGVVRTARAVEVEGVS
jgi:hypothetical protein